jgi:hypothetical protein
LTLRDGFSRFIATFSDEKWVPAHFFLSLQETTTMSNELLTMLEYLERERGISRETLLQAMQEAIIKAAGKGFGGYTRELRVEISPKTGKIRGVANVLVVDKVTNPQEEMLLARAQVMKPGIQAGEGDEPRGRRRQGFGHAAFPAAGPALALRQTTVDPELGNFMPSDGVMPGPCSQSQVAGVGPTIAGFLMAPEPSDAELAVGPLQQLLNLAAAHHQRLA